MFVRSNSSILSKSIPIPSSKFSFIAARPGLSTFNDFFLFKRTVDGQSFKLKGLNLFSNTGDPFEDYGFKVSNYVKIKNREICIDIRSIGDGYFNKKWQ